MLRQVDLELPCIPVCSWIFDAFDMIGSTCAGELEECRPAILPLAEFSSDLGPPPGAV